MKISKYSNIWLETGFNTHPKTIKLKFKLGKIGAYCLIMLFEYCRGSKPDGVLTGLSELDIALASTWVELSDLETMRDDEIKKQVKKFIDAFIFSEYGCYDKETGTYSIPSYPKRQPQLQQENQEKKIEQARHAANEKHGNVTVDIKKCKWLSPEGKFINVDMKKLPSNIYIDSAHYREPGTFREMFFNQSESEKNRLNNRLKKYTKECGCGKLFINDKGDLCHKCQ